MTDGEVHALESVACPGAGACGGQFTANTMATALDFLGVSAPGLNEVPATHPGKPQAAVAAGELAMKLVESDTRPSQVLTREAFENAIAAIAATGGSTNGVLHLLAIAAEVGRRALDRRLRHDLRRARRSSPTSSRAAATSRPTSSRPAASALVARELVRGGRRPRGRDRRRRPHAPPGRGRRVTRRPGQDVVVSWDDPLKPTGGLAILRGNLAPDGCVVKLAGHERLHHRGPARVFDSEEDCFAAVKARAIVPGDVVVIRYEGRPAGPGMREMLHVTAALVGEGLGDEVALITDGRFSGATHGLDGRPRRAGGVPRRPDRARPRRRHDRDRRREARAESRGAGGRARPPRRRVDAARAALRDRRLREVREAVGSASEGAVTR